MKHSQAVVLAYCGGRAIALGDRIREIPGELDHTVGRLPWVGFFLSASRAAR